MNNNSLDYQSIDNNNISEDDFHAIINDINLSGMDRRFYYRKIRHRELIIFKDSVFTSLIISKHDIDKRIIFENCRFDNRVEFYKLILNT